MKFRRGTWAPPLRGPLLLPLLLKKPLKKMEFLETLDKHKHRQKIQESGCGCSTRGHFDL